MQVLRLPFTVFGVAQDDRLLIKAEAAVDNERLSGDEFRTGGEEEDGLSDVVGVAVAAHGSFGGEASGLQLDSAGGFGG